MKLQPRFFAAIGSILLLMPVTAQAQTAILWKGTISTDWNTAGNWSPAQIPTAIDTVTINSGNVLVPANGVFSTLNWNGGDISGVLNVASGKVLTIGGAVFLDGALTNSGTINWTNGDINIANLVSTGGPIVNQAGATLNITCDHFLGAESSPGYPNYPNVYVVNAGLVRKLTTTGTTSFGGVAYATPFRNTGTVEADAGTIEFYNGATLGGTYTATTAAAVIEFFHGNYTVANMTVSGAGTVEVLGDSLTLSNDVIANLKVLGGKLFLGPSFQGGTITNLTVTGSTTALQGTNLVTGTLNWTGGYVDGVLNVAVGGVLNIGATVNLDGALTNSGTINWTNGDINIANLVNTGGPLVNQTGATFNIACDHTLSADNSPGYPTYPNSYVVNAGLVRKLTTTGTTSFGANSYATPFRNTGTVEADAGTIAFYSGGTLAGTYTATTAAAVIEFFHGNYIANIAANTTVSGVGTVEFVGDTLTLSNNFIPNLKFVSGQVILGPLFQGGTITNLTLTGSGTTLLGTNLVTGTLNWNGGYVDGVLNVAVGGVLNIGGTVNLDGALTNSGTINWTNGDINIANLVNTGGPLVNLAGATWNIACDHALSADNSPGYPTYPNSYVINAGLVRKLTTTGTTSFGLNSYATPFRNTGTVEADAGTILFYSGGALGGTYTATTAAAVIEFFHGNYIANIAANITVSGVGTVEFVGDTLTLSNNIIPNLKFVSGQIALGPLFQGGAITNLTLTGSGTTLQGTNLVTGTLNWTGGYIDGVLNVAVGGVLNIGGTVNLDGALTNSGTINWTNGDINIANLVNTGGPLVNLAGATWNIACDHILSADNSPGYPTYPNSYVVNAGLVRKLTTSGITQLGSAIYGAPFRNTGTVEADTGTIQFFNSVMLAGTYTTTTAGAAVQFAHGNYTATNFTVSGVGAVKFTGDSLILSNNVITNLQLLSGQLLLGPLFQGGTITNLTIAGVTLQGTNIVSGTLNWTGGVVGGVLNVANGGVLNIGGTVYLDGALTNSGTVNWTNGDINVAYQTTTGGPLVNQAGATWNIACDHILSANSAGGYPTYPNSYIVNRGLFRKTANTGVTEIGFHGAYNVLFKNSGNVEADAGTLSFEGGYQDDGTGKLVLSPAGLTGTNFGLISFYTKPVFHGSLNLSLTTRNGFQFASGQSFRLMSFPAATNWVSCLNGLDLENGILFQPQFTATTLSLVATAYNVSATKPQLFLGNTFGGVSVIWPDKFFAWTLQSATNLTSTLWTTVSACSDNALVPNAGQKQFFRLKQ